MKVLMFGWEFPPHISGGLGTACYGMTKSLAKLKVDIKFVLPHLNEEANVNQSIKFLGPKKVAKEVKKDEHLFSHLLKQYRVSSSLHPYIDKDGYVEYIEQVKEETVKKTDVSVVESDDDILEISGGYGMDLMSEVNRYAVVGKYLAQKESFDVIHAHDWMTFLAAIEAKKESGKPLVVHVHSTEFDRAGNAISTEVYCIEKYGMDMADRIITVSERMKEILVNKYTQKAEKIDVVYNAVEKDDVHEINRIVRHSSFSKDKIVLFLGRITMQKGPEYFLEAASMVLKKMRNVRFVMAGAGDMTPRIVEQMAELRLAERFHFTGFLEEAEREQLFAMSDLYVMPSVSEPFGITPLEAIRHNIPVVISKQSGVAEILPDAVQVDFWDVKKLSETIIKLISDPTESAKQIQGNQKVLREISWDNSAKDIFKSYEKSILPKEKLK